MKRIRQAEKSKASRPQEMISCNHRVRRVNLCCETVRITTQAILSGVGQRRQMQLLFEHQYDLLFGQAIGLLPKTILPT